MLAVGDKTQFYNSGLEEVEEQTVFCPNGHEPKKIPVDFVRGFWEPCNPKDMICAVCGSEMEF